MIPEGTRSHAINPLNWKTDGTLADKSLNQGTCFTDYEGNITQEIPQFTGAYIDEERGSLKVTDVTAEEYPAGLPIFEDGIYHLYDYQFFYRNLQENVDKRIDSYLLHLRKKNHVSIIHIGTFFRNTGLAFLYCN